MNINRDPENQIRPGLYTSKQLFISTIIGGPAIAGFVIACNLWAEKKKLQAIIPVLLGLFFDIILILPIYLGIRHIKSDVFRNLLAIAVLFILQTIFAFLLKTFVLRNRKTGIFIFSDIEEKIYHHRKLYPLIIISIIYFFTDFAFYYRSWIILSVFLFPHFYSYILIHKTFGNHKIAKFFLASVVFLACLFPFVQTAYEYFFALMHKGFLAYTYLNLIVGYYVIFIIYMFLFILGFNVIMLINRITGFLPLNFLKNKIVIFVTMLIVIASGVIILAIGTYINNNPVINKYSIILPKKSSALDSLKVISVSDLHLKNLTGTGFLKKLVRKIQAENPDIILLPGDIAETYGNTTAENLNTFLEILKGVKAEYGVYAIRGNHDYPGDLADKTGFYKRLGITMLADSLIEPDNKICIIGLNYRGNNEIRPIDSLLRLKTKDLPVILMDHAPYRLDDACSNKIDVLLSGHTHYGQIWPLNYITEAVYDIAWGYKKIGSTHIFVSCGVQDAILPGRQDLSIPVRTGSVSEILEINIEFR